MFRCIPALNGRLAGLLGGQDRGVAACLRAGPALPAAVGRPLGGAQLARRPGGGRALSLPRLAPPPPRLLPRRRASSASPPALPQVKAVLSTALSHLTHLRHLSLTSSPTTPAGQRPCRAPHQGPACSTSLTSLAFSDPTLTPPPAGQGRALHRALADCLRRPRRAGACVHLLIPRTSKLIKRPILAGRKAEREREPRHGGSPSASAPRIVLHALASLTAQHVNRIKSPDRWGGSQRAAVRAAQVPPALAPSLNTVRCTVF
jgi:hypothetical protein